MESTRGRKDSGLNPNIAQFCLIDTQRGLQNFDFSSQIHRIAPTKADSGSGPDPPLPSLQGEMVGFPTNFLFVCSEQGRSPAPYFRINTMHGICLIICLSLCSVSALNTFRASTTLSTSKSDDLNRLRCALTTAELSQLAHINGFIPRSLPLGNPISSFRLRGGGGKKGKEESEEESDVDE